MFSAIYIEAEVKDHPRVGEILRRFPQLPHIECTRYGELFNRKAQNFRLQKAAPALILARKHGNLVLPTPAGYGFESGPGFYFSHMLNCLYDCRYCFLQGMYQSAHYVLFVNYEDFQEQLQQFMATQNKAVFYSGYDCDSLALEPVSGFCRFILPLFAQNPQAILEIRSKSTQVRQLLESSPLNNVVIAMSFTPEKDSARWEHRVPSIAKRIDALQKLQAAGWPVALRFEPVMFGPEGLQPYRELLQQLADALDLAALHSVSAGEFRMPSAFYKKLVKLYPDEALFARSTIVSDGMTTLATADSDAMAAFEALLLAHVAPSQYYRCA